MLALTSQYLNQSVIDAAIALADQCFPTGECIVAAALTASGQILTSVHSPARVDSASLCAETGAICEAHKLQQQIVASVCLYRAGPEQPLCVLPACGICQERLAYWGLEVEIAVPNDNPEGVAGAPFWQARTLRQLRPFYWAECVD